MFARTAMGLLEFASRLCADDRSNQALTDFSAELAAVDGRYFARLPAPGPRPGWKRTHAEWTLPNGGEPADELLGALFTLIRHGQAHQGQQTMATLSDGAGFNISLAGVGEQTIDDLRQAPCSTWHLRVNALDAVSTWIQIQPAILYLHLRTAIEGASLLSRGLAFKYLTQDYKFDTNALRSALKAGGLRVVNESP
jgi:hypothetical protein